MNPLTAHLEKYQKQPPLIKEEDESAGGKKRPFSNCILFVLLAVFVFFLACLAVYTAVAMGITVEKNEAAPLKSELSSSKAEVLQDSMIDKTPPKEPNKTATNETRNSTVVVSNPSRLRIQIFIKGKEDDDSKENLNLEQNKTEEAMFDSIPKSRIFLRRIIIHNNGLNKPAIDSSEEVSSENDKSIKDVLGFNPFGIPNAPNPLEMFFNLLKLTEAPVDNIFSILEKEKNKASNTPSIEFPNKSVKTETTIPSEDQIKEDSNDVEKQINEQESNKSQQNEKLLSQEKPNVTRSEKEEISPIKDEKLNPVNDAQHMISSIQQKQHYDENMTPQVIRTPVIRFFRFINPQHTQNFSPMYQRTVYQHPNPFPQTMVRLPYSFENMANKGSFNSGHDKVIEHVYKPHTTMTPATIQTTIPPDVYSTTTSGYSVPWDKNTYREHLGETTTQQHKETQNQITPTSNKQDQPGMIDRIDTENIKPFEDFFKYRNL